MRRKNRQLKLTIDIPEYFDTEEDFMSALMDRLDGDAAEDETSDWHMGVQDEDEEVIPVKISKIILGEIEIEPEEED